ncbi:Serine/threonine-protein kinase [Cryptotrichosporon argae]
MLKGVKQLWPSSGASASGPSQSQSAASPTLSPSPSFASLGGPADQATPRASAQANPFDTPSLARAASGLSLAAPSHASAAGGAARPGSPPTGLRTPTTSSFALPLGTPGASAPTTAMTVGDTLGSTGGFGLHEPPKMRKALSKNGAPAPAPTDAEGSSPASAPRPASPATTPGPNTYANPLEPAAPPAGASTAATAGGAVDTADASSLSAGPAVAIRGTLNVRLISARGLNVGARVAASGAADAPQPYVVMQFEQNEFVSRTPHPVATAAAHQSVPFTQSQPQPLSRQSSGLGGIGGIGRAFAEAVGGRKKRDSSSSAAPSDSGLQTPKVEEPASWLGKPGPGDPIWKEEVTFDLTQATSVIHVSVYDRAKEGEGFLGMLQIKPVLKDGYTLDQWYKLSTRGAEVVTGEIWIQSTFTAIRNKIHLKPADFEFLKLIGRGTFGRVFQVRKKDTKRIYAMKVLSKKEIVAKKEVAHTIGERKILQRSLECPFLVGLKFSFQTEKELYFVTDYKCGGELFWHLQKEGRFSEDRARFYIAELVLALEHLHKYNIVYRDLKPENILLDATGHIALCDFGLSKPDLTNDQLTNTFCGTTEYLAPEVLLDEKGYGKHVDFWSLGVLLFEMCCGWSPFYAEQTQEMYRLICYGKIRFPKHVIGDDGKQFVKGLLNRNPQNRLGAKRGAAELKEHPFFSAIDWDALYRKQITPPFKPIVDSDESVANFDPEFTNASLADAGVVPQDDEPFSPAAGVRHSYVGPGGSLNNPSNVNKAGMAITKVQRPPNQPLGNNNSPLTSSVQENFRGFTYTGESLLPTSMLAESNMDDVDEEGDLEEAVDDDDDDDEDEDDEDGVEDKEMDGTRTRRQSDVDMD